MTIATERALELGRTVIIADVLAVHPGRPERCLCRGTAEIPFVGKPGQNICAVALTAFKEQCGFRVHDTPSGPHWKRGMSPEEWGLAQIYFASVRAFDWRQDFGRRFPLSA